MPIKRKKVVSKPPSKIKTLTKPTKPGIQGYWRITWMEQAEQDFIDEAEEGHFEFDARKGGTFSFAHVSGQMDCRTSLWEGSLCVEFTWDGHDELEHVQGRGWAVLGGDQLDGMIYFHQGDESAFRATRMAKVR